jgi:hypothetical protein
LVVVNANFVSNLPLVKLELTVLYTDSYPEEIPRLSLEPLGGEVDAEEINSLLASAQAVVSTLARLRYLYATLIGGTVGRGKRWDGDDLYHRLAATRAVINSHPD